MVRVQIFILELIYTYNNVFDVDFLVEISAPQRKRGARVRRAPNKEAGLAGLG
jgi:hypothetical protein